MRPDRSRNWQSLIPGVIFHILLQEASIINELTSYFNIFALWLRPFNDTRTQFMLKLSFLSNQLLYSIMEHQRKVKNRMRSESYLYLGMIKDIGSRILWTHAARINLLQRQNVNPRWRMNRGLPWCKRLLVIRTRIRDTLLAILSGIMPKACYSIVSFLMTNDIPGSTTKHRMPSFLFGLWTQPVLTRQCIFVHF